MRPTVPLLVLLAACSSTRPPLEPRVEAVNGAYELVGLVQTNVVRRGDLDEDEEKSETLQLETLRCYYLVSIVDGDGALVSMQVRDRDGSVLAQSSGERQVTARVCPEHDGEYEVGLRARGGDADYTLAVWVARSTSCEDPVRLRTDAAASQVGALRWTVWGTTANAPRLLDACASAGGPEQLYYVDVSEPSQLLAAVQAEYPAAVYILDDCQNIQTVLGCSTRAGGDPRHAAVRVQVEPGAYFVVVDTAGQIGGEYRLDVQTMSSALRTEACAQLPQLVEGRRRAPTRDAFDATCDPGAGPEQIERLTVEQPSVVRVRWSGAGPVYIRSACESERDEACGYGSAAAGLQPGQYVVMMEGGAGEVDLDVEPLEVPSGPCGRIPVRHLALGGTAEGDTNGWGNRMQATCAANAPGQEVVYRLAVPVRTTVDLSLETPDFDGALHIRSRCDDAQSEVDCNDDERDTRHSRIIRSLEPGQYFVIVDGYTPEGGGRYVLRAGVAATSAPSPSPTPRPSSSRLPPPPPPVTR